MPTFKVNAFAVVGAYSREYLTSDLSDITEQGQSDSVRTILERFSKDNTVSNQSNAKTSYAASFTDEEPLSSKVIDDLLESPDLSQMDELEAIEFINANTEFSSASESNPNPDPSENNTPPAPEDPPKAD